MSACSCGEGGPHVVSRRSMLSGARVELWSTGLLTWVFHGAIAGIGEAQSRWSQARDLEAGWRVMGLLGVLNSQELVPVIRKARALARESGWGNCSAADWEYEILKAADA